jgi:hypothetical protein|tara:strand:- start:2256 stop:2531 length:276 start_codon:yes stop_codon:yes gene_type:complete
MPESPERQLWRHVLYAVFFDLESASEHNFQNRVFAERWVGNYPSRDFRMVCDLAGLDPELVHAQFKKLQMADSFSTDEPAARTNMLCGVTD